MTPTQLAPASPVSTLDGEWHAVYDVVIAGYGYSGAMAAIAAADAGSSVAIFEKMTQPGGNSVLSGGGFVFGLDHQATLAYLRETCGGNTDDDLLSVFAEGLVQLPGILTPLAEAVGLKVHVEPQGDAAYHFPGAHTLQSLRVSRTENYPGVDWVRGARAGATAFWMLMSNVQARSDIDAHTNSRVVRLIMERGEVIGCEIDKDGRRQRIAARRAVILCTGGFEHNRRLIRHYVGREPAGPAVSPLGNTGDGILMGQKAGAALWHMWHLHGSYGFQIPEIPVSIRHSCTGPRTSDMPMPWILANRCGRRFMNEYPPAPQDTPIRDLLRYDADIQDYPNIPAYMIFDEDGRKLGPIASPVMKIADAQYEWSEDNLKEVENGHIKRADTIDELARNINLDSGTLSETIRQWNVAAEEGKDQEFRRPAWSILPISRPPYYAIDVYPIITNTQGGLVHDAQQRAIDPYGEPVRGLYKAGEMGSLFGHLYLLGGNNSECIIGGRTAGANAAMESPRSFGGSSSRSGKRA